MENNNNYVRGYKVFKKDWSCSPDRITKRQYSCPGYFESKHFPKVYKHGMHFCKKLNNCFTHYVFDLKEVKVAEVIAIGDIAVINDIYSTNKLMIVRELKFDEILELVNVGSDNTGRKNYGSNNTGTLNYGMYNKGWSNRGDCNIGYFNGGSNNIGDYNLGDSNKGNHNIGNFNEGDYNIGYYNKGNYNAGDFCVSNYNTGCFMTEKKANIMFFNKPSNWTYDEWLNSEAYSILEKIPCDTTIWATSENMSDKEKKENPSYIITGGYLKILDELNSRQVWWDNLEPLEKNIIKAIPNFDGDIFEQCTGIKVNIESE